MLKDGITFKNISFTSDRCYKRYNKLTLDGKTYRVIDCSNLLYSDRNNRCYFSNMNRGIMFIYKNIIYSIQGNKLHKYKYVFKMGSSLYVIKDVREALYLVYTRSNRGHNKYGIRFINAYYDSGYEKLANVTEEFGLTYVGKKYTSDSSFEDIDELVNVIYMNHLISFKEFRRKEGIW